MTTKLKLGSQVNPSHDHEVELEADLPYVVLKDLLQYCTH